MSELNQQVFSILDLIAIVIFVVSILGFIYTMRVTWLKRRVTHLEKLLALYKENTWVSSGIAKNKS